VFGDEEDFSLYLKLFRIACHRFFLRIWAYCLMTNHVHFVAVPEKPNSIAKVFHWCNGIYDKCFNAKYGLTGNAWESRPHSSVLDEGYTFNAIRYVERNPVRARMVPNASDYQWSSARVHCGIGDDPLVDLSWPGLKEIGDWAAWVDIPNNQVDDCTLRKNTFTGRPCGDQSFVRSIEMLTGRVLSPRKRGPKPKAKEGRSLFSDTTGAE
jgi:putative transposase